MAGLARHAAFARIHRGDELEAGRIGDVIIGAGHLRLARLQRLAQGLEDARLEFRQFVEEQDAMVAERNLAGPRLQPAADQCGHAGRMMRRAEGALAGYLAFRQFTGKGGDHARLQHLARIHGRQDRGQALRQHGFARPGRAHHQQMMAAGRRHFERPLRSLLTLDVLQIRKPAHVLGEAGLRPRQDLRALHMIEYLDDRLWAEDIDVIPGPGGFRAAGPGADEAEAPSIGGNRRGQCPGDGAQCAIEAHLADHDIAVEEILRQDAQRRKHGERDGEIIVAAFLGEVGRGEIDGEPLARQRQAHGKERRPDPLAAFHHRLVGEAHNIELDLARQELGLDIDRHSLDALEGDRRCMRRHESPSVQTITA